MSRKRGLGSGLDALIPSTAVTDQAVRLLDIDSIRQNRSQPRTIFDRQALDELAASIQEHGLIQPLIVIEAEAGAYELIAGERRWRAARLAGLDTVPALVKEATPQQLLELALVENIQRADLNALEEGQAYQTLRDEFGLKDEDIARRVGKSRVAVVNARRLIKLIPQAQQALLDNTISAGHGRALLRFEEPGEQLAALDLITRREISVRESERLGELAQNTALGGAARHALLAGQITPGQAQALLRIDDAAQQVSLLDQTLTLGLSSRETEQVADLVAEGVDVAKALSRIREGAVASDPAKPPVRALGSAPAEPQPKREQAAEDAASQRMFEEALATPVQLARSGSAIKLTITFYDDEQLQQFYDLVAGM